LGLGNALAAKTKQSKDAGVKAYPNPEDAGMRRFAPLALAAKTKQSKDAGVKAY
jgi:hypothetical protein